MFIAKLEGGLGNQMFQWAHARHLSLMHNVPFYLDLSYYNVQENVTQRQFALDKFPNLIYQSNAEIPASNKSLKTVTDNFHFAEFVYDGRFNFYFDGYWQCEKYFIRSQQIIRNEFAPPLQMRERFSAIVKGKQNIVSLHVRRGDYLQYSKVHPVLSKYYYEAAIKAVDDYDCLLVFSDDITWCRANLNFDKIVFLEQQDDIQDLWMMNMCSHNIIANSSFSWWGAWLNENANKKVIAPKGWFGEESGLNSNDIIPESWIVIDAD